MSSSNVCHRARSRAPGLGYDALADVQPHLVYVSISAFGQDGPRSSAQPGVPALDALRGMLGAAPSGLDPPRNLPVSDLAAGLYAAFSVSAALVAAKWQGRGVHIDVPMLGATLAIAALCAGDEGAQAAHRAGLVPAVTGSRIRSRARRTDFPGTVRRRPQGTARCRHLRQATMGRASAGP